VTPTVRPDHLVPGDPRHGVVGYARALATAAGCAVRDAAPQTPGGPLHLHFTDRLWGPTPADAAAAVERLALAHPLTVTLHDLPQPSDGAAHAQRSQAYRRVLAVARAVVCNSAWERELVAALAGAAPVAVIALAVIRRDGSPGPADVSGPHIATGPADATAPATVGLLGWIYPGKGHAEVINAVAGVGETDGSGAQVIALGGVSEGHGADVEALHALAARRGVKLVVTGYLDDSQLTDQARAVTVPVAAHQHISASGSINTWLSLGRRPLVSASPYAREMTRLRPGTLSLFEPAGLAAALGRALADPRSTWLAPDVDLAPDLGDTAAAYLRWWSEQVPW
jgi:hypothetical protein